MVGYSTGQHKGALMKTIPVSLFLVWLLSLTGCVSQPDQANTPTTTQIRYSAYLGKTIPLFILENGIPYSKKVLPDGSRRYAWNSGRNTPYRHPALLGKWAEDDWMRGECEIQILTDPQGRITTIYAHSDRRKNWDAARCRDYLK